VEKEHCVIENVNNTVTLYPGEEALCCVNGNIVSEHTKLTQGKILCKFFFFKRDFNNTLTLPSIEGCVYI
jgi:hypothetical protein